MAILWLYYLTLLVILNLALVAQACYRRVDVQDENHETPFATAPPALIRPDQLIQIDISSNTPVTITVKTQPGNCDILCKVCYEVSFALIFQILA